MQKYTIFTAFDTVDMQKKTDNWFVSWFDTPYYHMLYRHRDVEEARLLIDNLVAFLQFNDETKILDMPCGRGRHSVYLNSLGFDVTGVDLSENSIAYAKAFEKEKLRFRVHDMRTPMDQQYDVVLNLFTSFGYFEDRNEDIEVLKTIRSALKTDGVAVIDFINADKVKSTLVTEECQTIEGIDFYIKRSFKDQFIVKEIRFSHKKKDFCFTEKVRGLSLSDFNSYFKEVGIRLRATFGDYRLKAYDPLTSDRLIMILGK